MICILHITKQTTITKYKSKILWWNRRGKGSPFQRKVILALKWFFNTSSWPEDKKMTVNIKFNIQQNYALTSKAILKHVQTNKPREFPSIRPAQGDLIFNIVQDERKWYQREEIKSKEIGKYIDKSKWILSPENSDI